MSANRARKSLVSLQQTPQQDGLLLAIKFVKRNLTAIAVSSGAALLIILIISVFVYQRRQAEKSASRMLLNAASPQQQESIFRQYPSSSSAPAALLALASSYYHSRAYDEAYGHYVLFEREYADHPMAVAARLGRLFSEEARGQVQSALDGFSKFAEENPDHYLVPQSLFGKARCLQALGRSDEAQSTYEDFISTHAESAWTPVAEASLKNLRREHKSTEKAK